jgi:hypothetical protein
VLSSWFTWLRARRVLGFVADDGDVARFVFKPRDLNRDGLPKPKAFAPELNPQLLRFDVGWNSDPEAKDARLALQVELAAAVAAAAVRRSPEDSAGR